MPDEATVIGEDGEDNKNDGKRWKGMGKDGRSVEGGM